MFSWLKRKVFPSPPHPLRALAFGDVPLDQWPHSGDHSLLEPWAGFRRAQAALQLGNRAEAETTLLQITETLGLESRQYLQAWHFLRQLGVHPSEAVATHVYGVVTEVALEQGLDVVAAYEDRTARYLNFSGAAAIWEHPDSSLDAQIDALLQAGREVAARILPNPGDRPPPPKAEHARITILTPRGLPYGEGIIDTLSADPLAGPVIAASLKIMLSLVELTSKKR